MAGLFAAFAYAVMPGLRRGDDRTFVTAMQQINTAILNGWFMTCFLGAIAALGVAAAAQWTGGDRKVFALVVAALVLYLAMFVITSAVNVPLNDQLADAGRPDHIADLAAVRERFESTWVAWNVVRAVTSTGAFLCLAWALVLHGRSTR
ncbi:anthrone oxygenase family protein [Streptomyces carpinensis]|uniref:Anthrone oxygenase family protein n=1 Tax=Streptomyces carpinensis TaxID=66369 RepID=A0ABV1WI84_9ACTN